MKGVDEFLKRLHEAQKRKIEETEVFLLPSQKMEKKKFNVTLWRDIENRIERKNSRSPKTKMQ